MYIRTGIFLLSLAVAGSSPISFTVLIQAGETGRIEITTAGYGFVALTGTRRRHRFGIFGVRFWRMVGITESFITGAKRVSGVPTESGFMVV